MQKSHPPTSLTYTPSIRYNPHLPSYPTRRSSDLPQKLSQPLERDSLEQFLKSAAAAGQGNDGIAVCEDRKSTRLNSSHVAISYAVFCLKKKESGFFHLSDLPLLKIACMPTLPACA